jgi:hypothetical protein
VLLSFLIPVGRRQLVWHSHSCSEILVCQVDIGSLKVAVVPVDQCFGHCISPETHSEIVRSTVIKEITIIAS